jgi:CheY-like chemotaxis protein
VPHIERFLDAPPAPRARVLVFGQIPAQADSLAGYDTVRLSDPEAVANALHDGGFAAVLADATQLTDLLDNAQRNALLVSYTDRGFAFTDTTGTVLWRNQKLAGWCDSEPIGQKLFSALKHSGIASSESDPLKTALAGQSVALRLHRPEQTPEYLDVRVHPVLGPDGSVQQLVCLCRDVTAEVEQQLKFDALHQAGRQLVELDADTISDVSIPERIESLKDNLRRLIHDLLHYDIIELRIFDRKTNELKPLLEEGMTPEAATRKLEALPKHNGVTGWVAYHRKSYLCNDASTDALYIQGATGARSSLTVPVIDGFDLVGTFNVESPRLDAFSEDDLQFTELFSKEIATALHTLDLLNAQQTCAATQSVEMVSKEIALPTDEILASAAVLLKKLGDRDDSIVDHLRRIVTKARDVKDCVRRVGEQADTTSTPKPLHDKKILVIEQDPRFRREAHLILERMGATAETVGTAAEGLALIASVEYDVVLLEVSPADLSGYDTYKSILQTRPTLRVAMFNGFGYNKDHSIVRARADGLKHVIFRPFKPDQLVKAILD